MEFLQNILKFLDSKWDTPQPYGLFHLICFALVFVAAFILCYLWKKGIIKNAPRVVLVTAIIVAIFELYKQINFSFGYEGGITFNYQWYAFPWQFCSTPLFVGLAAGLTKGKIHHHLTAYLATYAMFAGFGVMFYPVTVFTDTIGICVQTMICHGSMITVAIFLYYSGYVKAEIDTLWKALPVFALNMGIALTLNEVAYFTGLTNEHTFNMFFISPHFESDLPVYSLIHNALRGTLWGYILSILLYFLGFSICALVMVLIPMGIKKLFEYDFDAYYEEKDRLAAEKKALRAEQRKLEEEKTLAEVLERAEQRKKEIEAKKEKLRQKRAEMRKKAEERRKKREEKLSEEKRKERKEKRERAEKKKKERKEKAKEAKRKRKAEKLRKKEEQKRHAEEKKKSKEAEQRELLGKERYEKKQIEKLAKKHRVLKIKSSTLKWEVTVNEYKDGDTTLFNVDENGMIGKSSQPPVEDGIIKVRYLAIASPEFNIKLKKFEKGGKTAADFVKDTLDKATSIIIESDNKKWNLDKYERPLVWVWYKTNDMKKYRNLNIELLQEGYADLWEEK